MVRSYPEPPVPCEAVFDNLPLRLGAPKDLVAEPMLGWVPRVEFATRFLHPGLGLKGFRGVGCSPDLQNHAIARLAPVYLEVHGTY